MTLTETWALALFGWLGYNLIVFYIEKNAADEKDEPFNYVHFKNTHWDNWLVTFVFAIPIVYWGHELHDGVVSYIFVHAFGLEIPWHDVYYMGPGIFVEMLVWGIKKLKEKLNKFD